MNGNRIRSADMDDVLIGVEEALEELRRGRMLIVVDDDDRENEGDFVMAAEKATPEAVNFMAVRGRGLLCQAITADRARRLDLPPMTDWNSSAHTTAFTVSVDARGVTSTGISAYDRAATIRVLVDPASVPEDLLRPGHIFPLVARDGGVLERPGHTEVSVDLPRLAGLAPSGILCEIMDDDGRMARLPRLAEIAREHGLKIVTVRDVAAYRERTERPAERPAEPPSAVAPEGAPAELKRVAETMLPTDLGEFRLVLYAHGGEPGVSHFALLHGDPGGSAAPLVRIHSECLTGESLLSRRCDCGFQLREAMRRIRREGGIVVYLRQEGRGIGFADKIRAYALQDAGCDTVEANLRLGLPADARNYEAGARILEDLGVREVRLLTNNPDKIASLEANGIRVSERLPLEAEPHAENRGYLSVKKRRCGHLLELC